MTIDPMWMSARAAELKASILFLTRLRFGGETPISGGAVAQAAWAFPVAGLVVGCVGAAVYGLAHGAGLTPWPSAALSVAATLLVTGCLHEDGLADTADGFGGGNTREQKLAIMRDSRIGAYGVCALIVVLLLRVGLIANAATPVAAVWALLAAHGAARAVMPAFMAVVPPARSDGLSAGAGQPPRQSVWAAVILGLLILALCLGMGQGLAALILVAIAAALLAWLSVAQIDGQTGDVLGAVEQVSETLILLVALR